MNVLKTGKGLYIYKNIQLCIFPHFRRVLTQVSSPLTTATHQTTGLLSVHQELTFWLFSIALPSACVSLTECKLQEGRDSCKESVAHDTLLINIY